MIALAASPARATSYPSACLHGLVEQFRLADGTPIVIRPIAPMDRRRHWRFVVADAWQRRGIGGQLLLGLGRAATLAGVTSMSGITLATNNAMLRLARQFGLAVSREPDDWTVKRISWRQPWSAPAPATPERPTPAAAQ